MILPDNDSLKPALYQGIVVGLFAIGFFEKLFLKLLQSFVNAISGFLLSTTDHLCDVLLELRLVGGRITKERVDGLNYHILQYRLIDGSCVAFLPSWLQSTDAAPDDGFAAAIVPVDSAEHFTAFAANDNLCKAVVAVVGAFLPLTLVLTTRLRASSSCTRKEMSFGIIASWLPST